MSVQILKSFIFMHYIYGIQQILLLNFVFMHTAQKFQLVVFMGIAKLNAKKTCIHANIMKKF